MQGKSLVDMEVLAKAGAVGFTDDGIPIMDAALVRKAMEAAKEVDMPISLHEEDPTLIINNGINRGKASAHFGIGGSPREAEISLVERDLQIALETGACMNVQHISTKEAVELVRQAKKKGNNVHAEATPHHFALTEEAAIEYGTLAKMNPPLREEEDRMAIIEGLKDGTIDLIATDHAPHTMEEKAKPITEAPSGIIGLETAVAVSWDVMVRQCGMEPLKWAANWIVHPNRLIGLTPPTLAEGALAELAIFDLDEPWVVDPEAFASKSADTPWAGKTLRGIAIATYRKGKLRMPTR
jgi:dihydroorotase